jgi:WW domain-containing oxidoreductase
MSLYSSFKRLRDPGLGYGSTAEQVVEGVELTGKTVLVTGCTSGLGFETMRVLTQRGARVFGTARTLAKAQEACVRVGGEAQGFACELAEPVSVRACVDAILRTGRPLDAVICNAGVMALPKLKQAYGVELQFFTNHIGHFALVNGLLSQLSENGRVVMVSSAAHRRAPAEGIQFDNLSGERGYRPWPAYGQSKLANILFAKELSRRLRGSTQTANAIHPGVIDTDLNRHLDSGAQLALALAAPLVLKNVKEGAATQVFVAVHPSAAGITGQYFVDCAVAEPRPQAEDDALARKLWDVSEELVTRVR